MERNVAYIALFAALIAALGIIPKITLGFGVPITAQSLGVMLCGTLLGAKRGALAVSLFLILVAVGLPLLAGGRGGIGLFASPSAGFLFGFPVAAFITGVIVQKWQSAPKAIVSGVAAIIGGVVVLYVFGAVGMSITLDKTLFEVIPLLTAFIPGDVVKAILAGIITASIIRARPSIEDDLA